jgi:predicted nucleic acid-binding protein
MDLADRYCHRTETLLRMLDNSDLGAYVPEIVKAEIRRVLHLPEEGAGEAAKQ